MARLDFSALVNRPMLMGGDGLIRMASAIRAEQNGGGALRAFQAAGAPSTSAGMIAMIPLLGMIEERASDWLEFFGGTALDTFRAQLLAALSDPNIKKIAIEIDSPGGTTYGVMETADLIRQARDTKPIVALVRGDMASAALWIGTAASEVVATPSSFVGSHGVWTVHEDWSVAIDQSGVKVTLISAGKYKMEANPFQPLTDEARAYIQQQVDQMYANFTAGLARNRGVSKSKVESGFGQGRMLSAQDALDAGMIDRIAPLEKFMADFAKPTRGMRSETERERLLMRHRLRERNHA